MNVPRLRFKDFTDKWENRKIKDFLLSHKGGAPLKPADFEKNSGYEVIPKKAISSGGKLSLDLNDATFCSESFFKSNSRSVVDESYLITTLRDLVPSGPSIGYIVKFTSNKSYLLAQGVYGIKIDKNLVESFLIHYSNTDKYRVMMQTMMVGSTQVHIRNSDFFKTPVNIPSLPEQTKIANFLTEIDEKITQLTQKYDLLKQYKKGVMQEIFSQKLRFKDGDGREFPEWEVKQLGEISKFLDGRRKPIKESDRLKMKGKYPYYGASGIIDYINDYIFDEDIILLGVDGENIVSRNLPLAFKVSGKCWINNHAHVIKPNHLINIDFLTQYLDSLSYIKYNTGTAQPKLNQEVCRTIPLNLSTLPEQTNIANFLTVIDDKITQTQAQLNAVKLYKKGLLQQLFV